eukprot:g34331.t1
MGEESGQRVTSAEIKTKGDKRGVGMKCDEQEQWTFEWNHSKAFFSIDLKANVPWKTYMMRYPIKTLYAGLWVLWILDNPMGSICFLLRVS